MITVTDKIWIPEAKSREMIKETHKILSHARADKVLHYIGNAYDMTKYMKEVVKETIVRAKHAKRTMQSLQR